MNTILNKENCTGCGACKNTCRHQAISMEEDEEGFFYPQIKEDNCINCHLCEKVCPVLNLWSAENDNKYPIFYAGQLKTQSDLYEVSSGGAFWAFAQSILKSYGIVYGAVQTNIGIVQHQRVETLEEAKKLRKSKYLQSDTGLTFVQAEEDLKTGRTVLYSGTPCQITGLLHYLGKCYENLYTCDVVCHGVPSNRVWRQYKKEKERRVKKTIKELVFRDKTYGWSNNHYRIVYDDGTIELERSSRQLFHFGYLRGLFYRSSCGNCKFARIPRTSDVTLADYWKYTGTKFRKGKDLGVSLICVNSRKGHDLLTKSREWLCVERSNMKEAKASCYHLSHHPVESAMRDSFFTDFKYRGYHSVIKKYISSYYYPNIMARIKNICKRIMSGKNQ